jgi:23S rRNA (guanosine2251-2'-O)-methyltransferase
MTSNFVGGRNAVRECLRNKRLGFEVVKVADSASGTVIDDIISAASDRNVPVRTVSAEELDEQSSPGNHQGVLAVLSDIHPHTLDDLLSRMSESSYTHKRIFVLDQIQDPVNLGKIARSALYFGYVGIVKTKDQTAPLNSTVIETSAGAAARLPIAQVTNLRRALERLREERFWMTGLSLEADSPVDSVPTDRNLAVLLGHEGTGLRRLTREECDYLVNIPGRGDFDSLNVATAGSIAAYALDSDPSGEAENGS